MIILFKNFYFIIYKTIPLYTLGCGIYLFDNVTIPKCDVFIYLCTTSDWFILFTVVIWVQILFIITSKN